MPSGVRSPSCITAGYVLPSVVGAMQGKGRQLHTLSNTVPECLSLGRARTLRYICAGSGDKASCVHHRGLRPGRDTGGRPLSDAAKPPVSSRTLLERVYTERTASSRVKQNTVASTIIRCSTTPMRRARATVARFLPRRAARRNAQASVMGQLMSSTFITQLAGATRLTVHGRGSCRRPCIQGESLDFDCVDRCLCLLESGHLPVSPPGTCFRPWSAPCRARAANFIPCPIQFPSAYLWGVLP